MTYARVAPQTLRAQAARERSMAHPDLLSPLVVPETEPERLAPRFKPVPLVDGVGRRIRLRLNDLRSSRRKLEKRVAEHPFDENAKGKLARVKSEQKFLRSLVSNGDRS